MTTRGAKVEFRNVSKVFNQREASQAAVHNLSMTIEAGEICVLVGPSGCGKTTSLKMVNRLVEPSSGTILIDGTDIKSLPIDTLRRQIGYVIQQVGLFPHWTIFDNVATVPRLLKWPEQKIKERTESLIDLVGLDPNKVRDRYPSQLSGGERQRIGVARALAAEPPLLLMDEPFGAVDPVVRARLQDEFLRIHETVGMTVIFVTHDIDEAVKLGTRVAVMQTGGRIAQFCDPATLLTHPDTDEVAEFVGPDRLLKRLALLKVSDIVRNPVDDTLLVTIPAETPVRDALAVLIVSGGRANINRNGSKIGSLTLEDVEVVLKGES